MNSQKLQKIGFIKVRQKGGYARQKYPDPRAIIIPIHGKAEIEGWLSYETLEQLWR